MMIPRPGSASCSARAMATVARSSSGSSPTRASSGYGVPQPLEHGGGIGALLPPPDGPGEPVRAEPAHSEVLHHGEFVDQPEALVHDGEPLRLRLPRADGQPQRRTVDEDPTARVGRVVAGQDLGEGGLARSVLTDQPVDLTRRHVQVDVPQRSEPAEGLGDSFDAQSLHDRASVAHDG